MDHPGRAFGELFFYVLVVAGIIWLIVYLARRKGSGQSSQARWQHAVQVCSADPRYRLGQITHIAQSYPQRGVAVWVTWYGTGQQQSTWLEGVHPPVGAWVVVTGGPGPDPSAFHVSQLHDVIV